MGIPGLLQALKAFTEPVEINKYTGKRIGIDAYSWLHKGAYACSMEICENKVTNGGNGSLPVYVQYCMHRINMLRHYGVTPVVVFDGGYLPQKAPTETDRARKRKLYLDQARLKVSSGDFDGAIECYQRAVEITPLMAYELIKVLMRESIEYIVAPYEADSQLAYLAKKSPSEGGVDAVITEDSDLLAYGCDVVIYKMDRYGNGEEIELKRVLNSHSGYSKECLSFRTFTSHLFTGMCVLAGCDFLPSVPGIGLKKAHALVSKYTNLDRVISVLRCDKKMKLSDGYASEFKKAMALFMHARVYNSEDQELCYLSPLTEAVLKEFGKELDFLGPNIPRNSMVDIAEGRIDPITMLSFGVQMTRVDEQRETISERTASHKVKACSMELCTQTQEIFSSIPFRSKDNENVSQRARSDTAFLAHIEYYKLKSTKLTPLENDPRLHIEGNKPSDTTSKVSPNNNPFKKRPSDTNECWRLLKKKK